MRISTRSFVRLPAAFSIVAALLSVPTAIEFDLAAAQETSAQEASAADDKLAAGSHDDKSAAAASANDEPIVRPTKPCAPLDAGALREIALLGDNRFRHADALIHLALLPDGKRLLASAEDGTARLWDCESGKELQRFYNGQGGYVWGCAAINDGKHVLTCGADKRITRWDAASGKQLHRYEQQHVAYRLAVAPGGERFAAAGDGSRTILWNTETGDRVRTHRGHGDSVYGAAIDDDGRFLVTCGNDQTVAVWNLDDGRSRHKLDHGGDPVYTVAFAPEGVRFASCGESTVRLWNAENGEQAWSTTLPNTVYVVAWSPDGKRVACTCTDSHIYVLDAAEGREVLKINVPYRYHWPVVFSSDGASLYSGGNGQIWKWDAASGKQLFPNPDEKSLIGPVTAMAVSPLGDVAYLCGQDSQIHVWSVARQQRIAAWPTASAVKSLDVSPNGQRLLAADNANVHVLDAATGNAISTIKCGNLGSAAFVDAARRVVTIGGEQMAQIRDAATGQQVATLSGHLKSIEHISISADGDRIVTASNDGTIRVWGAHSGNELSRIGTPNEDGTNNLKLPTFLADNRSLAISEISDGSKQLRVWLAPSLDHNASLTAAEVQRLIADLSSDKYSVRQAATEALVRVAGAMREQIQTGASADDPEVVWRLRQIMLGVERGETPTAPVGPSLALDDAPQSIAVHPDGIHFALAIRVDAAAKIVVGRFTKNGPQQLHTLDTGHSPSKVTFSAVGRRLFAANRDGTVSVYEAPPRP